MVDQAPDHTELYDDLAARRYFAKFDRITGHMPRVAAELERDGHLSRPELRLMGGYMEALQRSFQALSLKYLMTGRAEGAGIRQRLAFDRHESGFPVAAELLFMANDTAQAMGHLAALPSEDELKDRMIRQIVGEHTLPTGLQYSLAQRLYYQMLVQGGLFLARNDVQAQWLAGDDGQRRTWLLSWAVYDTLVNLPVIYLMQVEDSGRVPLPRDDRRWPAAQSHLMAQSLNGLKLLTIAQGFDTDYDDLHPKHLKRLHLGPMYSSAFTLQSGPIGEVLAEARAPEGQDWSLVWTLEVLTASGSQREKTGWFSTAERQTFALDPFMGRGAETGASATHRFVILPERPYQVLAERNPPGFHDVTRFVVAPAGHVMKVR
ncbi:hypothetical protein SAMN05421774_104201 [Gemmobacter megaterium]|uniref:Uncharacterized protein n=1 Tax=Gemmobacter megaterium TaxID=1086013 RepID=A0A1N7NWY1_9RHOB|nr:hypothetical protein [Gemmobacter megaterium]GGE16118.1 hypothetical protein GCM10011345_22520 [Gemmobacter megaterium]SIT02837.1 hypothetical protein SAMN05421774_104201 [Gemmobacter megaterium]